MDNNYLGGYKGALLIYWDYELQTGADKASKKVWKGIDDYEQTKTILDYLEKHEISSTFAVVGEAARRGKLPYHAPEQIKEISRSHEIASHTLSHRNIAALSYSELVHSLRESKRIVEKTIKKKIYSFVPPYNMPINKFGLTINTKINKGPLISKLSMSQILQALKETGYKTIRLYNASYLQRFLFDKHRSHKPKMKNNILLFKINSEAGFAKNTIEVIKHAMKNRGVGVIYAHPHSLKLNNSQNIKYFKPFIKYISKLKEEKKLLITTPYELYQKLSKSD